MRRIKLLLAGLLIFGPTAAFADPIGFTFEQGGFLDGDGVEGIVTGKFLGIDSNDNGQLSSFDGEILDFMMSFSGNGLVGAFSLGLDDLFGLVYDLDGGPLGDGLSLDVEGIGAFGLFFGYVAGPGLGDVCGIGVECSLVYDDNSFGESVSGELVTVRQVPEPGTLGLLGLGLIGMGVARRNKKF